MSVVISWSIGIIISGIIIGEGAVKVFPPPSFTPAILALTWIIILEAGVILAHISTKGMK